MKSNSPVLQERSFEKATIEPLYGVPFLLLEDSEDTKVTLKMVFNGIDIHGTRSTPGRRKFFSCYVALEKELKAI